MKTEFGWMKSARGPREGYGPGFNSGAEAGRGISLRQGVNGGSFAGQLKG